MKSLGSGPESFKIKVNMQSSACLKMLLTRMAMIDLPGFRNTDCDRSVKFYPNFDALHYLIVASFDC